ncbi:MAG: YfhO family protein [Bacteroidales bacterium]|nr:YfhO family protein [Bacteroidales bacterium]
MKDKLKGILPHLLVVVVFIVVSAIYFFPILDGQGLIQGDNVHAEGMSKELVDFENSTGESSSWSNSMFGGMPAYQIKSPDSFNIHLTLQRVLRLFLPYTTMAIFFIYLLGFYFLLSSLDFKRSIAIIGAFAFALSSYNIIIIAAGHITKCYAIAYMAPVVAGLIYIFKKKYLLGGIITAFSLGIEISCNHTQILYYLAFICLFYVIYKCVMAYKEKLMPEFGKCCAVAAIACVFAVLPNITNLWTTWEYSKYSTRSQSELTSKQNSSGLDKDYALAWSYGVSESFNLFIPDFKGGASGYLQSDENAVKAVKDNELAQNILSSNHYWGDQPFTSGPVYVGAIIFFLFVLGMFIVKNPAKWWLLAITLVSLIFSWGKNFGIITDFIFDYVPMYNKFRSVSMALVMAQFSIPFLAMMALKEISDNPDFIKTKKTEFICSLAITAGLCLVFCIFPGNESLLSNQESAYFTDQISKGDQQSQIYQQFQDGLISARKAVLRSDAMRSMWFILLAAGVIFFFCSSKMKEKFLFIAIGGLIICDLWVVDYRYLGPKDYTTQSETQVFNPTPADKFIKADKDPNFRVLDLTKNVFNDGVTPYFHKTIGGYHGAKMRRYQEFIDTILAPVVNTAQYFAQNSPEQLNTFLASNETLNMLNTKFIITNPQQMPVVNMNAYGNAWFVNKYDLVENADQEIGNLKKVDPLLTAVINKNLFKDYISQLPKDQISAEDSSAIVLAEYKPNYLKYNCLAFRDKIAVFSEIYYPKGWQAYLDGKPVDHICADYIFRAMAVPSGQHTIEFKFDPTSVKVGSIISAIASILIILATLGYIVKYYLDNNKKQEALLAEKVNK